MKKTELSCTRIQPKALRKEIESLQSQLTEAKAEIERLRDVPYAISLWANEHEYNIHKIGKPYKDSVTNCIRYLIVVIKKDGRGINVILELDILFWVKHEMRVAALKGGE